MHGPADALAYGVKVTGCTLFVVDAGVDTGPIVAQAAVPVAGRRHVETLHERIKVAERQMLVETVGRMARDGFTINDRKVRIGASTDERRSTRTGSRSGGRWSPSTTSPAWRSWSAACTTPASSWSPPAARRR